MKLFSKEVLIVLLLTFVSSSSGMTQQLQGSGTFREVLLCGTEEECILEVELYENNLVDIVVQTNNGDILFFKSEMTYYGCEISHEPFILADKPGTMILMKICNGGNFNPYESLFLFVSDEQQVYCSVTPTEWHSQGGPGPYYPNMVDVNGDSIYDHFAEPGYLFYLPDECQALKRQLWLDFLKVPYVATGGELRLEDSTLEVLTNSESQQFRDAWINSMSEWLAESGELCQSNPSMLTVRGSVWALREALDSDNYETFTELYAEL